jgi:uncharacterized coiled-coil protein SlyX
MRHLVNAYLHQIIDAHLNSRLVEIEKVVAATEAASAEQIHALAGVRSSIDALVESIQAHNQALDGTSTALRDLLIRIRAVERLMLNENKEPPP